MGRIDREKQLVHQLDVHRIEHSKIDADPETGERIERLFRGDPVRVPENSVGTPHMIEQRKPITQNQLLTGDLLLGDQLADHRIEPFDDLRLALAER